jgi:hypothetical protein
MILHVCVYLSIMHIDFSILLYMRACHGYLTEHMKVGFLSLYIVKETGSPLLFLFLLSCQDQVISLSVPYVC